MKFIEVNGHSIHYKYLKISHSRTYIFVNSLGTDFRIWDEVVENLRNDGSILCFDKRGHGLSESTNQPLSIQDYAEDLMGLMDALDIQTCVLVGLSIGGMIGQYLAIHHPERLEKLILSNTAPKVGNENQWNSRIEAIKKEGIASISSNILERWLSANFLNTQTSAVAGLKRMLENCDNNGYIRACEAIRDMFLGDQIQQISTPTLCLAGSEDVATAPELVAAMATNIAQAKYFLIEGVGHLPCVEVPEQVSTLIREFSEDDTLTLYEKGMKTRRMVLGNAHVDKAEANKTDFDKDFQTYITNNAWGAIWSRPHLTKRERSLITIAILTALKLEEELAMHIRATRNTGASEQDVKEVLLHTGIYAGVPVTNGAMKIAKNIFQ